MTGKKFDSVFYNFLWKWTQFYYLISFINLEGYWKYGDRCTFAHGDIDMRAKFVPAESLYPTASPVMQIEKPMVPMAYGGGVDYSGFSQPMMPVHSTGMLYSQPPVDQMIPSRDPFEMTELVDQLTEEEDTNSFMNKFNYSDSTHSASNGFTSKATQIVSPFAISIDKRTNGKSKFIFDYESLTESIGDLELTNLSDKEWKTKFDQAKFEIEIGNTQEAERILKEMMDNKEIKYKEFTIDNGAFMNALTPISD